MSTEEQAAGLHDRTNVALRVRWVNQLRKLVGASCPRNKLGVPLVTDVDLLLAPEELRKQALTDITNARV